MFFMQKIQSFLASAVIVSALSHIFCCGIPLVFSIFSMLVGLGVASVIPLGLVEFHEMLHAWEEPVLIFSGVVLFVGWTLHIISERLDCNHSGCHHEPCEPKKKKSSRILIFATVLFVINMSVLMSAH